MPRRRFKQTNTLEQRLAAEAERLRQLASDTPDPADKEALLHRALQYDAATHMEGYLRSNELKAPS